MPDSRSSSLTRGQPLLFKGSQGAFDELASRGSPIVKVSESDFSLAVESWADILVTHRQKGLRPLVITGSGVSAGQIPSLGEIIDDLHKNYRDSSSIGSTRLQAHIDTSRLEQLSSLFDAWRTSGIRDKRAVVNLLNFLQDPRSPANRLWLETNYKLFDKVLNTPPNATHRLIANLYRDYHAILLTLNFDGLVVRALQELGLQAFSLPTPESLLTYLVRQDSQENAAEIQLRGDIFYLVCYGNRPDSTSGFCPQRGKSIPLWSALSWPRSKKAASSAITKDLLKCPTCGSQRSSYLSFPGAYEKERETQQLLTLFWKYLAFQVGSVTVIGLSGWWDPLIIAFLAELLRERDIPMLVVDRDAAGSYLVRELVLPTRVRAVALDADHLKFTDQLTKALSHQSGAPRAQTISPSTGAAWQDGFWSDQALGKDRNEKLYQAVNPPFSELESRIASHLSTHLHLDAYAQLGLKSYWLDASPEDRSWHTRLHHSQGVRGIASFLYANVTGETGSKASAELSFLRLAALLHDIGHVPFAHLVEELFHDLSWKPAGYVSRFHHTHNTAAEISRLLSLTPDYERGLRDLGYTERELVRLINGCLGIPYLDAIINSPVDADKVDYVFRDARLTKTPINISPREFLVDMATGTTKTPEGLLMLSDVAARAAMDLLEARSFLYERVYLRPSIRYLEAAVKFILILYLVHGVVPRQSRNLDQVGGFSDLGPHKIKASLERLNTLLRHSHWRRSVGIDDREPELIIIDYLSQFLTRPTSPLSAKAKESVRFCWRLISETRGLARLNDLSGKILTIEPSALGTGEAGRLRSAAKKCMLRLPGSYYIDIVSLPPFLSCAEGRMRRQRSDGTTTESECVLVPARSPWGGTYTQGTEAGILSKWQNEERRASSVFLFPMTYDQSYLSQAENLFEKLRFEGDGLD